VFHFHFLVDGCEGPDSVRSCHGFGDSLEGCRDSQATAVMDLYIKKWICSYTFHNAGKANEAGLLQGWVHWIWEDGLSGRCSGTGFLTTKNLQVVTATRQSSSYPE
jgi:hypothetical protein